MRYHKAGGNTLRLLMDAAVPRRSDGALALCQDCQRRVWYAGGYVPLLAEQLLHLAKVEEMLKSNIKWLRRIKVGDQRAFTTPRRERLIEMAKELADQLEWGILIQRQGYGRVVFTRIPHREKAA